MSELHRSNHIHVPTDAEYLADMSYDERFAYMSFYTAITHPDYRRRQANLHDLWPDREGDLDWHPQLLHNIYKTAMNTIYIVGWTTESHPSPENHLLVAAELRDGEMHVDHPEIINVHIGRSRAGEQFKVIDAKWNETSKKTTLQFHERHASLIEEGPLGRAYPPIEIVEPL